MLNKVVYKGWSQIDGNQNRYFLINDLFRQRMHKYVKLSYEYHTGLDLMAKDLKGAKEKIKSSLVDID